MKNCKVTIPGFHPAGYLSLHIFIVNEISLDLLIERLT